MDHPAVSSSWASVVKESSVCVLLKGMMAKLKTAIRGNPDHIVMLVFLTLSERSVSICPFWRWDLSASRVMVSRQKVRHVDLSASLACIFSILKAKTDSRRDQCCRFEVMARKKQERGEIISSIRVEEHPSKSQTPRLCRR